MKRAKIKPKFSSTIQMQFCRFSFLSTFSSLIFFRSKNVWVVFFISKMFPCNSKPCLPFNSCYLLLLMFPSNATDVKNDVITRSHLFHCACVDVYVLARLNNTCVACAAKHINSLCKMDLSNIEHFANCTAFLILFLALPLILLQSSTVWNAQAKWNSQELSLHRIQDHLISDGKLKDSVQNRVRSFSNW